MSTPEPDSYTHGVAPPVNGAPWDVALEATATRAEQPAAIDYPVEPGPPLG